MGVLKDVIEAVIVTVGVVCLPRCCVHQELNCLLDKRQIHAK